MKVIVLNQRFGVRFFHNSIQLIKERVSKCQYWLSRIILYILVRLQKYSFPSKRLLRIFYRDHSNLFNKFFYFLLKNFEYHGSDFLESDLERVVEVGRLRYDYISALERGSEPSPINETSTTNVRIGFFAVFGHEANFSIDFFKRAPKGAHIFLYDLISYSKDYSGTDLFTSRPFIKYRKTPRLNSWWKSTYNYERLVQIMNKDQLDVLVTACSHFCLPIYDSLKCKKIVAFNTSSMLLPHPKCTLQTFIQPPWPYVERNGYAYNLKTRKKIEDCRIFPDTFAFNYRGVDAFDSLPLPERKKQIYFTGNLRKILSQAYCSLLIGLLKKFSDLEFVYYGRYDKVAATYLLSLFNDSGVLNRTHYRGSYTVSKDKTGNIVDDGKVFQAYGDLCESRLVMNTFPISGARNIIEAYCAEVPVIHLDFHEKDWLLNQKLQPFKLSLILTSSGAANSVEQYLEKCEKVISDDKYALKIVGEQKNLVKNLTDPEKIWKKFLEMIT